MQESRKLLSSIFGLATAVVVSLVAVQLTSSGEAGAHSHIESCKGLDLPVNAAHDLSLDLEGKLLHIEWAELGEPTAEAVHNSGRIRNTVIDYTSKACLEHPAVSIEIERLLDRVEEQRVGSCKWMIEFLASGAETLEGERVNVQAGKDFVAKECADVLG